MRTLIALAAALIVPAFPVLAQDKSASINFDLSKDQLSKIRQINARFDAQVKAAFAGDEKTVAAMQAELKQIGAETDPLKRKTAIAAYQAKHAKAYKAALAKGKVNLGAWASELKTVAPNYAFLVKDGTHIVALGGSDTSGDPLPAPTAPTVKTLRGSDFTFVKEVGCGPISGNDVTRSGMDMTNDTWAAELGGCTNSGILTHVLDVPSDQPALIELKSDLSSEVWAVGVVAVALSIGGTSLAIDGPGRDYFKGKSYYCSAGAPLLWAASESCGGENIRLSDRGETTGSYELISKTYTSTVAGGVVAITTASATIRDFSAKITLEPR